MESPEKPEQVNENTSIPLKNPEEVVRAIGLVFSNTYLYGAQHGVTKKAMNDGFSLLSEALNQVDEIRLRSCLFIVVVS